MSRSRQIGLAVFLLLIAYFVRAHRIQALPPFNDESHHIRRAEQVWSFSDPDLSFTPGKLLTYYWYGLFNAERPQAIFVTRTATALFSLIGLAAAFAIARRLFGAWAGVLALYLLTFAPFMVFFDRMALADPLTAALGALTVWASLHLVDHPEKWTWGMLTGFIAALTILAKLTGFPFALMPLWAVLVLEDSSLREKIRRYQNSLFFCYMTLIAILMPFALRVLFKELTGNRISVVDNHLMNHQSPLQTLADNLADLWEANLIFNGAIFFVLAGVAIVIAARRQPRPMIFALGCAVIPLATVVLTSGVMSTRYMQIGVIPFFVLIAGASGDVRFMPGNLRWSVGWLAATVWIVMVAQPFILNSWNDPRANELPDRARWEYFQNFTAGYALTSAAELLPTLDASETGRIPVIGIVGSCHQMRLYLDESVLLDCPAFGWNGEFMDEVATFVDDRLREEGTLYLLVEPQLPYADLTRLHIQHQVLARFERPFNGMHVELWRVFEAAP
jgi:4-amino-4-deoxy-L-arabinose transferase-like glycosyltransferase